jgi:glucose/arabinose dehydrogenase
MARRIALGVVALVLGLASTLAAQIRGETIVRGLVTPVAVVPDPTDRAVLIIVEQRGLVRVARDGALLDEPFLDLQSEVSSDGERGLLGLAFAPDYAESRRFFVNFTNRNGDTVVARFLRHPEQPAVADRSSRFDFQWPDGRRIIEQPFSNHNGGHLAFGPDGYLYVGLGDGGSGGDPMNNAQNPNALLGKMLRLDVNVADDDPRGYRVPEDNPFVDGDPIRALGEIWAFGLRNPWRYTFDDATRGGTSALLIGDVGQNAREELNFEPAGRGGRNYGWRMREGRQPFEPRTTAAFQPIVEPIHDYGRSIGASVTGGLVYRGTALDPSYEGRYFYADFVSGRVFSVGLHLDAEGEARADDEREHTGALGGRDALGNVSSFAQDPDGEILVLNYSAGTIVRIVPDFAEVPMAPTDLAVEFVGGRVALAWAEAAGGAEAAGYAVERVRDGRLAERVRVERPTAAFDASGGDCFRVRAQSRAGTFGPAGRAICYPAP